ncbi:MAG TPA: maleylpyruvate isomerase family mycothiol-dependent enzyme [Streptomyces sp.]|jgi:uncharacterized protein (TIGR03083 family)|nr:maleylpyruvate isomerase family mycothiol-dependent enzyme [Streptomyces sp.]
MDTTASIDALEREGAALLAAAEDAGLDADVPTCPQWQVRDLLLHTSNVHRWASGYVRDERSSPVPIGGEKAEDEDLPDWYRSGLAELVESLRAAGDDVRCWTFLRGSPSPRAFWARRQAHETAVHRVDAELAAGRELTPVSETFAADGVDELLTGFHARERSRVRSPRPRTLCLRATDGAQRQWTLLLGDEPPRLLREEPEAPDCTVSGPAGTLYLTLWNRLHYGDGLVIEGDAALAELWRETSAIV